MHEITRQALNALKADITDDNATLETSLTLKDNIIDVKKTPPVEDQPPLPKAENASQIAVISTPENASEKPQSKLEVAGKALGNLMNYAMSGL